VTHRRATAESYELISSVKSTTTGYDGEDVGTAPIHGLAASPERSFAPLKFFVEKLR